MRTDESVTHPQNNNAQNVNPMAMEAIASRVVIFTDIDDSLLQTDRAGNPLSYFTAAQQRLLQMFQDSKAALIPVTGRYTEALQRVNYPFDNYCVVSHGAVVLNPSGQACQNWLQTIEPELTHWPELLTNANQEINEIIEVENLDARSRVIVDQDIPAYVSVKGSCDALDRIRHSSTLDQYFFRHENGRNHALLPPYASKQRAIQYLQQTLELDANDLVIGIGDSLSDLGFLQACQFAMIPCNSQIMNERLALP